MPACAHFSQTRAPVLLDWSTALNVCSFVYSRLGGIYCAVECTIDCCDGLIKMHHLTPCIFGLSYVCLSRTAQCTLYPPEPPWALHRRWLLSSSATDALRFTKWHRRFVVLVSGTLIYGRGDDKEFKKAAAQDADGAGARDLACQLTMCFAPLYSITIFRDPSLPTAASEDLASSVVLLMVCQPCPWSQGRGERIAVLTYAQSLLTK